MQLSLDYMNKRGYVCHIVEKWIPGANVRKDAFGFGDILAYGKATWNDGFIGGIILVQTTSWNNFSARKTKILNSPHLSGWCQAGGRVFLQAWGAKGLREEEL
jgi:hypothetical protein